MIFRATVQKTLFGEESDTTRFETIATKPAGGESYRGQVLVSQINYCCGPEGPDQPTPRLKRELLRQLHLISNRGGPKKRCATGSRVVAPK